ncbi:ATP-binding cassette domain-containing protein [Bacteriovoracaceae bacterium]|nr:ATP-binding cassette domain-containing protein [Bacteriovoracaceae bacterium]
MSESEIHYAIEFQKVTKTFGTHSVLKEVDFKIHEGKITTILGFSGAGKSTLLKHILGILKPTEGHIRVLDEDMANMSELQIREFRKNFGMVFQYAALFDSMSSFGNVAFPLKEFTSLNLEEIKDKVHKLLHSVGLTDESFDKLPSELSGGMRKRVGLARALALSPRVMLYDEPTTGLDPITTHMVDDLILSTAALGQVRKMTSVIISHDIAATLRISDYIAFLEQGEVVEHLPTQEFKKSENPIIRRFLDL